MVGPGRKLPSIAMFMAVFLSFSIATIDTAAQIWMLVVTLRTSLITGVTKAVPTHGPVRISVGLVTPNTLSIWAMVVQVRASVKVPL